MFSRTSTCENLARYAVKASYEALSADVVKKTKDHLLDSMGCALGAMHAGPIQAIRAEQAPYSEGPCTFIGGGCAAPERATFYNTALTRYLDFMDTFVTPGEACHPSDNIGGVLAAGELTGISGRDLLAAIALAYDVQWRLTSSGVPLMKAGFDHTVTQAISLAAGVARALGLSEREAANAIAISSCGGAGLAAARTGQHLSQWKGLASADMAMHVVHSALLAARGITGPLHVFEGPLGWKQMLGKEFPNAWRGRYDGILNENLKKFNAEFHSQSCIEALLEMRARQSIDPEGVRGVEIEIFDVAYEMIGGGRYLDPKTVATKEDADHSLHYMAAVALLDGQLEPEQYEASRIQSKDVQSLMQRVTVKRSSAYTRRYPKTMSCRIRIKRAAGRTLRCEKKDFEGFYRRPMPREQVINKFLRLGRKARSHGELRRIVDHVMNLESRSAGELMKALQSKA